MTDYEAGDAGSARWQAPWVLGIVLFSLLLAGCFGSGGDGDVWDEDEVGVGQSIAITEQLPAERDGSYDGVYLELSEGWAEVLGVERELPFEGPRIRISVTVSTDSRERCDLGEMAVRDDAAGERHVFLQDGDCIDKGGEVTITGVFDNGEPLAVTGVETPGPFD